MLKRLTPSLFGIRLRQGFGGLLIPIAGLRPALY